MSDNKLLAVLGVAFLTFLLGMMHFNIEEKRLAASAPVQATVGDLALGGPFRTSAGTIITINSGAVSIGSTPLPSGTVIIFK